MMVTVCYPGRKLKASISIVNTLIRYKTSKTEENGTNQAIEPKHNQQNGKGRMQQSQPNAEYLKGANEINKAFNDRLKQVFVTSQSNNAQIPKDKELLPRDRSSVTSDLPHSQLVSERTPNKLLVDDIRTILDNYKRDPDKWTIGHIAQQYQISKGIIEKLVVNYGSLNTFFAERPAKSDDSIPRREELEGIRSGTSYWDVENILVGKDRPKWLSYETSMKRLFADSNKETPKKLSCESEEKKNEK